jgi:hypothetical protein
MLYSQYASRPRRPRRGAGSALRQLEDAERAAPQWESSPHCGLLYVPGANSLGALEQCLTHALHPARRLVASRSTRFLQCRVEGSRWRFRRSGRTPRLALSASSDGTVRSISLALRRQVRRRVGGFYRRGVQLEQLQRDQSLLARQHDEARYQLADASQKIGCLRARSDWLHAQLSRRRRRALALAGFAERSELGQGGWRIARDSPATLGG